MSTRLRAVVREPVTHFVLIGLMLFAVDWMVSGEEAPAAAAREEAPRTPIVVDAGVRERLAAQWSNAHPAPPTEAELEALVQGWIEQEVLYREGLRRRLDEGDLEVRDRVASQMAYVLRSRISIPAPSESELEAWFDAHADRYAEPERVDFTQVFVDGKDEAAMARAREILATLQAGADPDGLGDRFSGGRRFRGRKATDLAVRFGDAFVDGLAEQSVDTWALRRSVDGIHLVRIDGRSAGRAPRLEAQREQVLHDWEREKEQEALQQEIQQLRAHWEVQELR